MVCWKFFPFNLEVDRNILENLNKHCEDFMRYFSCGREKPRMSFE